MVSRARLTMGLLAGMLVLVAGGLVVSAQKPASRATPADDLAVQEKVLRYIRARFGVADAVKMTMDPLRRYSTTGFWEATITVDDGKQKTPRNVYLTEDRRYLIMGSIQNLGGDAKGEIVGHVRKQFKLPETTQLTVGNFKPSAYPNLQAIPVTIDDGKNKQTTDFFVTADNRFFVLGTVFNMSVDPRREALRVINTANQPSQGPVNAPVTIVEYADLQCSTCARLQEFLEKELLPRFPNKLRIVFKEFPLTQFHDWSMAGAIASQCAYQINPPAHLAYRSAILRNQPNINAANSRTMLIDLGEQAGIDRIQLTACIDSKASLPRVEQNVREGQAAGVGSTPTVFINGKMIVGMPPADSYFKAVEEALQPRRQATGN